MGADYLAVRACAAHRAVGVHEFLAAVKASAVVRALAELPTLQLTAGFPAEALQECSTCPISGGRALGCYRYVHYPVDSQFEQQLFAYFVAMQAKGTAAYAAATDAEGRELTAGQLLRQCVIAELPEDTPWATRRGRAEDGGLALLPEPIRATVSEGVDASSALVLHATFHPIDDDLALQLFAWFFRDLFRWLEAQGIAVEPGSTLSEVRSVADLLVAAGKLCSTESVSVHVFS